MQEQYVWMMYGVPLSLAFLIGGIIVIRSKMGDRRRAKASARREWLNKWLNPTIRLEMLHKKLREVNGQSKKPLFFEHFGMFSFADMAKMFDLSQVWQLVEILVNGVDAENVSSLSGGAFTHQDAFTLNIAQQIVVFFGGHQFARNAIKKIEWSRHHGVETTLLNAIDMLEEAHMQILRGQAEEELERRGYAGMGITPPPVVEAEDML